MPHGDASDNWWLVATRVQAGARPPLPPSDACEGVSPRCHALYVSLLAACWAQNPEQRPSFARVCTALRSVLDAAGVTLAALERADKAAASRLRERGTLSLAVSSGSTAQPGTPPAASAAHCVRVYDSSDEGQGSTGLSSGGLAASSGSSALPSTI